MIKIGIDKATGLLWTIKRPAPEVRTYSVDFRKLLTSITGITSITPQPAGNVTDTDTLIINSSSYTGSVLFFDASHGTDAEDYEVHMVVLDENGKTVVDDILIKVRKAGLQ